jgi:hypothetical protein
MPMSLEWLRDQFQLRTRVKRAAAVTADWYLRSSQDGKPPPPPPVNEIDPARLERFCEFRPDVPGHAEIFLRDAQALFGPVFDDEVHLRAVLEWLLRAQAQNGNGGFSVGYAFATSWYPDYPETTGYIIPTLWDAFHRFGDERYRAAAIRAADWEIEIQMPSGAVKAGYHGEDPYGYWSGDERPAVFNTGQVMQGWNRTFEETRDTRYLAAASRAAQYFASCLDDHGAVVNGLSPTTAGGSRAYYARAGYGLAWTGLLAQNEAWIRAARRHLEWVNNQQQLNGWVARASFGNPDGERDPLTHTLAYTAEGLLETGLLLNEPSFLAASYRLAEAVRHVCERRGMFLPATINDRLKSQDLFSCLPGNAQFACLWLRHGVRCGDLQMLNTGLKMVDQLKGLQSLDSENEGIRGGVAGSWPIDGGYSVFFYVNWAAKYFADSLLLAEQAKRYISAHA